MTKMLVDKYLKESGTIATPTPTLRIFQEIKPQLAKLLNEAQQTAQKEDKPILIVVGEDHVGKGSLAVELAVLEGLHTTTSDIVVETHQYERFFDSSVNQLNQNHHNMQFLWNVIRHLKMRPINGDPHHELANPIDSDQFNITPEVNRKREEGMKVVLLDQKQDTIAFIGERHMRALANDRDLNGAFSVVPIDATRFKIGKPGFFKDRNKIVYFSFSKEAADEVLALDRGTLISIMFPKLKTLHSPLTTITYFKIKEWQSSAKETLGKMFGNNVSPIATTSKSVEIPSRSNVLNREAFFNIGQKYFDQGF